ncbi:MerR family transcriptional regulator [Streptomyces sp. NPDC051133]|uniref:MerR family transcriptional regulator n=1 Tax=Streptomyces sp. NPDC051133 TaxID=3155521 RepID=UPI003449580A
MDSGTLCSIGELARRTGLTVKTIRFYSDRGIVRPAGRTSAGYRRYGPDAVARLGLVRTLRDLGFGLDVIRRVMDRERTLSEVAAEHAAALEVQIGILRLRQAVLAIAAGHDTTFEEMERMHRLATLSEAERRRLIDAFLDAIFEDASWGTAGLGAVRRSLTPELPDSPTPEQVQAWVELAQLSADAGFRAGAGSLVDAYAAELPDGAATPPRPDVLAVTRGIVESAVASGVRPDSPQADSVVAELTARCALVVGRPDDGLLRDWLLHRLEAVNDPRWSRYLSLLAVINGWPAPEPLAPVIEWSVRALRTRRR